MSTFFNIKSTHYPHTNKAGISRVTFVPKGLLLLSIISSICILKLFLFFLLISSKAEKLDGNWYSIRKYHVEGQGLPGGPKQFSNFNVAIPVGLGYKQTINRRWSIGFEFGIRKTFTDYIDGVSTNYYDKTKLIQVYGATAAQLADPSLGKIDGATNAGQERGNPRYKDSYMLLTMNIGYKISKKKYSARAKF